jgi:hypothetical protein
MRLFLAVTMLATFFLVSCTGYTALRVEAEVEGNVVVIDLEKDNSCPECPECPVCPECSEPLSTEEVKIADVEEAGDTTDPEDDAVETNEEKE